MNWNILLIALIAMVIFQILGIRMQSKRSSNLTNLMNSFDDEAKFFELAEQVEQEEKNAEYLQKCRVVHLWGAAYYHKDEDFKKTLDSLDLTVLTSKDGKIAINEDAFFYLYLIIPHFLYTENKLEQAQLLNDKLSTVHASDTLVYTLSKENEKFYKNEEDLGQGFYEKVLNGEYSEYKYSKQLIGLYKNIISTMLAAIYKKQNDTAKFNEILSDVREFDKTPLGNRWIKELGLENDVIQEETEEIQKTDEVEEDKEDKQ